MAHWLAAISVLLLSFLFFWGAAPCWHFERLWRERHRDSAPSDLMLRVGLSPIERRHASAKVFAVVGAIIVGACALFGETDPSHLAIAVGIGALAGFGLVV
jgi:hypothetical protein